LNEFFCEFYGALLGDGCISRFRDSLDNEKYAIYFSGNNSLDQNYFKFLKGKIRSEWGLSPYYYEYPKRNTCILSIRNKNFCIDLNESYGVPMGLKYQKLSISDKVLKSSWTLRKAFIRGLFDTDGSIYARKDEDYRFPIISISSKNQSFLETIKEMLREQNYPAYTSLGKVALRGIKNINRWFEDIGSSNDRNILKYQYFLKKGRLPPKILGS
jgi:hypothetical protein